MVVPSSLHRRYTLNDLLHFRLRYLLTVRLDLVRVFVVLPRNCKAGTTTKTACKLPLHAIYNEGFRCVGAGIVGVRTGAIAKDESDVFVGRGVHNDVPIRRCFNHFGDTKSFRHKCWLVHEHICW